MSDLYCLKCKKYHHHNYHKCDILSLVPVTRRCRTLADTLYSMGIELFGVAHFTQKVNGSENYIINVIVELKSISQIELLNRLLPKWKIHTETYSSDRTPLVVPILAYYETYCYDGVKGVDNRVQEIIDEFVKYLSDNFDADGFKAVTTLMYS